MKILIVAGKLTYSNPSTYTLQLAGGLRDQGHEVQVAALGGPLFAQIARIGVESYLVKFNFLSFRRLLQYLREFGPDVIHATGGSPALKTAVRFARHLGAHLIHTVHSWLPGDRAERLPALVRGVVVVNEDLREHLVNELNVPKGMIRVIPYGVNVPPEAPPEPEGSSRIPIVGTIGRLEKERRYNEFLEAVARAREINDNAHFMIAGEGPGEDRLRKQAKELGLTDCVTFVQPQGNHEEIYSVMDILVVLSDWGGVGLTLLEAMARECPVIATGGGELFSILGEEKICVIVPGGDVGRLADEICALLSDPQRRRELGRNARRHVLEKYPLEAEVLRVEEYYGEVVFQGTR